ncbi:MAG: M16 family metallopeptidase, partial [Gaiellaceae bacterium]
MQKYVLSELDSGQRVVTERLTHVRSVALGFWIGAGSRDERDERAGVSHFIEHLLFKGTERRTAKEIAHSLESRGGHLDAYTTREYVCYYARFLEEDLAAALDVLADLMGHATLSDEEITREKAVVHEEIQSYEDNPEEKVNDLLGEALWGEDPLGWPILGTLETIEALPPPSIRGFYREHYRTESLVISISGRFDPEAAAEAVARHFDVAHGNGTAASRTPE